LSTAANADAACTVVLGTGGTIAGTGASAASPLDYRAAVLPVTQLLASIPCMAGLPIRAEQLVQIDSKDMSAAVWRSLAKRCAELLAQPQVRGIVVTHGTDTVEETAFLLHRLLAADKPVVLTCAMRPATDLGADGPQNLADAVAVANTPGAAGVLLVCAGRIHDPVHASKVHPYRLDAFDSGDAGPIGFVEDGRVRLVRPWRSAGAGGGGRPAWLEAAQWPWVEILTSHACAGGEAVQLLCAAGVAGIVVAGTGNGSLHVALEAALLRAQALGIRVVRSSRCGAGRVLPGAADRLPATPLSPVKARIALQLELLAARADPGGAA
jgi:L-asparaginase